MRYAWIAEQDKAFALTEMCEVLAVSISGYRAWKRGGRPNRKRLTDVQMLALIRAIHAEIKGAYGSPRMARELRARGFPAGKERVERLMRENGIHARHKRRYKVTTDSKHGLPVADNLLDRNFTPTAPNQVWTSDISAPCRRGWRNPNHAGWLSTGSWNAALSGRDTEQKGAAKFCRVLTVGCHKQSSLNCTGREPFFTGRATTAFMVRQRSMRRTPLYL